ncbi:MAG: DJ-1 family protein [Chitinivibrionales bacterium]|nr:DJ-1 family protein [Chitinivibrionales bacterium]
MTARATIVLADGFEETEAITTIDLLRRGGVTVTVAGLNDSRVTGAHDIVVETDTTLPEASPDFDAIVLPGGQPGTTNLGNDQALLKLLRQSYDQGRLCAAICAAPSVLGKAGILDQKTATCYPGFEPQLHGAVLSDKAVVIDGNVITSRGPGTAIPFAIELIAYLVDRATANTVAEKVLYTQNA